MSYPDRLLAIGLELVNPFTKAKEHQLIRCLGCSHEWLATPISKLQNFKKHGKTGCPICTNVDKYKQQRNAFLAKLAAMEHIEILSEYDGSQDFKGEETKVHFRNLICDHDFWTYPNYLINGKSKYDCIVCGNSDRSSQVSARNLANRFYNDPKIWNDYKYLVASYTRKTYLEYKHIINPHDLPIGINGTEGAYQVDHIVPKAIGFQLSIPAELLSHHTNLQMLSWEENIAHKDKIKEGQEIPELLKEYFKS